MRALSNPLKHMMKFSHARFLIVDRNRSGREGVPL